MRLLDLCAGVGGFSYAAHRLGWETAAFCERDEYCQKVLAKNFPGVPIYDDVYTFPSEPFRGRIDVLAGGFPCQPFSQAGKRLGVNDERHLFPEMLRIIREVQPAWAVLENVNGLVTMALEVRDVKVGRTKYSRTEDIDDYEAIYTRTETMLLNSICEEIEREGYAVQPVIIPAVSLEADHERKRIWIVARRNDRDAPQPEPCGPGGDAADTKGENGCGLPIRETAEYAVARHADSPTPDAPDTRTARRQRQQTDDAGCCRCGSNLCRGCDGADRGGDDRNSIGDNSQAVGQVRERANSEPRGSDALDTLPDPTQGQRIERDGPGPSRLRHRENVRRPANWYEAATRFCRVPDGSAAELDEPGARDNRVDRLEALGNMIYWPCAFEIFTAIEANMTESDI